MYFSVNIIRDLLDYAIAMGVDVSAWEQQWEKLSKQKHVDYDPIVSLLNHVSLELDDAYLGSICSNQCTQI